MLGGVDGRRIAFITGVGGDHVNLRLGWFEVGRGGVAQGAGFGVVSWIILDLDVLHPFLRAFLRTAALLVSQGKELGFVQSSLPWSCRDDSVVLDGCRVIQLNPGVLPVPVGTLHLCLERGPVRAQAGHLASIAVPVAALLTVSLQRGAEDELLAAGAVLLCAISSYLGTGVRSHRADGGALEHVLRAKGEEIFAAAFARVPLC